MKCPNRGRQRADQGAIPDAAYSESASNGASMSTPSRSLFPKLAFFISLLMAWPGEDGGDDNADSDWSDSGSAGFHTSQTFFITLLGRAWLCYPNPYDSPTGANCHWALGRRILADHQARHAG